MPPLDLTLRPATADDVDDLWTLHRDTMQAYVDQTWGWDEDWQAAHFRDRFDPTDQYIILLGTEAVGMIKLAQHPDHIFLAVIEISPAHQGQGIGSTLITQVQREAAADGRTVRLRVLNVNPARRLYERLGFRVTEVNDTHTTMEWQPAV